MELDPEADFLEQERKSLDVHVGSCVRRFALLLRELEIIKANARKRDAQLVRIELGIAAMLIFSAGAGYVTLRDIIPALQALAAGAVAAR